MGKSSRRPEGDLVLQIASTPPNSPKQSPAGVVLVLHSQDAQQETPEE